MTRPSDAPEDFARAPWRHVLHAKADFTPKPRDTDYNSAPPEEYDADDRRHPHWAELKDDNLASSVAKHSFNTDAPQFHLPVLDLDFPAALIPSTTPGHFHLYLGRALSWADYVRLLTLLGEVGILEDGYVQASLRRGYTAVRLPWISKEKA